MLFIICLSFTCLFCLFSVANGQMDIKNSALDQVNVAFSETGADVNTPPSPQIIIVGVIRILLAMTGILFVSLVVCGGFLMITAHGEEEKSKKGMQIIQTAVIGLIIVLLSYSITLFFGERINPLMTEGQRAIK